MSHHRNLYDSNFRLAGAVLFALLGCPPPETSPPVPPSTILDPTAVGQQRCGPHATASIWADAPRRQPRLLVEGIDTYECEALQMLVYLGKKELRPPSVATVEAKLEPGIAKIFAGPFMCDIEVPRSDRDIVIVVAGDAHEATMRREAFTRSQARRIRRIQRDREAQTRSCLTSRRQLGAN